MSTILDALRKVEREKKAARRQHAAPVDDATAARELVGGYGRKATVELSPKHLMAGIAIAGCVIIGVSVGLSQWFASRPAATAALQATAVPPNLPMPEPQRAEAAVTEAASLPVAADPPSPPPVPVVTAAVSPEVRVPAPKPAPTPPPVPAPAAPAPPPATAADDMAAQTVPAVVVEELPDTPAPPVPSEQQWPLPEEPVNVARVAPAPVTVPPAEPARAERVPYDASQRSSLPLMNETDRRRFGLSGTKINMVRPVTDANPYASVIINLVPVQIGEVIPNSTVRVIAVDMDGIVVEAVAGGERYFMRVL